MPTLINAGPVPLAAPQPSPAARNGAEAPRAPSPAWADLERSVAAALETYANVHRGSGHFSQASTLLYERARELVLDYLDLPHGEYTVIFGSPRRAAWLAAQFKPGSFRVVSSADLGLPFGVHALALRRGDLPGGAPAEQGGGTARLVGPGWVVWAKSPDKFEPGTPAIVNVIAFARALQLTRTYGADAFRTAPAAGPDPAASGKLGDPAALLHRDDLEPYRGAELLARLRATHIGRDVRVPTLAGPSRFINLDNGASTPTFAPIWDTVRAAWQLPIDAQPALVQAAKVICARVLGAPPADYDVLFTANTTASINLVAASLGRAQAEPGAGPGTGPGTEPVVVTTLLEHNSNELPWRTIAGATVVRLGFDADGLLDPAELETLLRAYNEQGQHGPQRVKLVAVSGASNVLGTCNDLAALAAIAHRYGAQFLVDGAQLVAHRPVTLAAWGIDYLAFSGHKVYAPFGTGVLVARQGLLTHTPAALAELRAAGEENVGGIAALGKALLLLERIGLDVVQAEEQTLTAQALRGLAQVPGLTVYGIQDPAAPSFAHKGGVLPFNVGETLSTTVGADLAERAGIGIRCGCHCAHLTVKRMLHIHPMLERFQRVIVTLFPKLSLPGVARVSLGLENTPEDVDALLTALGDVAAHPKAVAGQAQVREQMAAFAEGVAARVYA